jgi:hypothetical protein
MARTAFRLATACSVFALLCMLENGVARANAVDPDDEMLFALHVAGTTVNQNVHGFSTSSGLCLDLRDLISGLALPLTVSADSTSASGWIGAESNRVLFDFQAHVFTQGSTAEPIPDSAIWTSRTGPCILSSNLSSWMNLKIAPDLANAILDVSTPGGFPIEAALKRANSAARLLKTIALPQESSNILNLPYLPWRTPAIDASFAFSAERTKGSVTRLSGGYEIIAVGELAWLSANARIASNNTGLPKTIRLRLYRDNSNGEELGPLHATSFAIGDVNSLSSGLGTSSLAGSGIVAGNRPLGSSDRPDLADFTGTLPQGWDVEVYRNGDLIRSVTELTDGRYMFRDVPLQVGANDFEIVQYGPQGQVRRTRRSLQVGSQTPARGQTWWTVAAVDGEKDLIALVNKPMRASARAGWRFDLGLQHGFGRGYALAVQYHNFTLPDGVRTGIAEVQATATVLGIYTNVEGAMAPTGGHAFRARTMGRVMGYAWSFEHLLNNGLSSERVIANQRRITAFSLDRTFQVSDQIIPIHFDLRSEAGTQGNNTQAQARIALANRKFSTSAAVVMADSAGSDGTHSRRWTASTLFNGRIAGVRLRSEINWGLSAKPTLDLASLSGTYQPSARQLLTVTTGFERAGGAVFGQLDWSRNIGVADFTFGGQIDSRGGFRAGIGFRFGIRPDENGRFSNMSGTGQTNTGQIAVRAFRDLNSNGARDQDEPLTSLPGVVVNGIPVFSGDSIQDNPLNRMEPAIPVKINLNSDSINDPSDIQSTPPIMVMPRAGIVTAVEFGIASTGIIEGNIKYNDGHAVQLTLELVRQDGSVASRLNPDIDGYFSIEKVRLGKYNLRFLDGIDFLGGIVIDINKNNRLVRLGKIVCPYNNKSDDNQYNSKKFQPSSTCDFNLNVFQNNI